MLDRVREIGPAAIDAGLGQQLVQDVSGGADERSTDNVFPVAGLLTDEHEACVGRSFTEDRLRGAGNVVEGRS